MNWTRNWRSLAIALKSNAKVKKCGSLLYDGMISDWSGLGNERNIAYGFHRFLGCIALEAKYGSKDLVNQEKWSLACDMQSNIKHEYAVKGNFVGSKSIFINLSRKYGKTSGTEPTLDRDFLVQLWMEDKKMKRAKEMKRRKVVKCVKDAEVLLNNEPSPIHPLEMLFSRTSLTEEKSDWLPVNHGTNVLKPTSSEEARVFPLLARSILLITRDIEWANLAFGIEQENRYAVIDVSYPQSPVGFIREQSNWLARQMLRQRRPFIAYFTDATSNELFRVRRPFWWLTSSIYTEVDGKVIGVVHQRWHLWKRIYDLYLGNKQFAVVENPGFWNWTFTLKDINGQVLAEIDRNWRGFGFEILTDAGQYVIRFGPTCNNTIEKVQELEVARPLTLSERAVTLALAVSLDNDYFSRHGGWGIPFFVMGE